MKDRPIPLLVDTDPGVDDLFALAHAVYCPRLRVVSVTAVYGNTDVATAARNARNFLQMASPEHHVPVALGASSPWRGERNTAGEDVHGTGGVGGVHIDTSAEPILPSAATLIWETAQRFPGQLVIVALGPLTNLARCLELYPQVTRLDPRIVIMGGAVSSDGNVTKYAEANFYQDPDAAALVLGADWHTTLVGLDVTRSVVMSDLTIAAMRASAEPVTALLGKAVDSFANFFRTMQGLGGAYMHDPTAMCYVCMPELYTVCDLELEVSVRGERRGQTLVAAANTLPAAESQSTTNHVAIDVDTSGVLRHLVDCLPGFGQHLV